jgi:hypothetical protein
MQRRTALFANRVPLLHQFIHEKPGDLGKTLPKGG